MRLNDFINALARVEDDLDGDDPEISVFPTDTPHLFFAIDRIEHDGGNSPIQIIIKPVGSY